jgi:uncharacterized protein (TIGR02217 family)
VTGFHDVRFPEQLAVGALGGPAFSTRVIEAASGYEQRNRNWSQARGRWTVATGIKRRSEIEQLIAFFRARAGRAYGFRFKDHNDHQAEIQLLGVGDGSTTQFQLVKHYGSGPVTETRTITKPVQGTVAMYLDGAPQGSGWSVNHLTGIVTFSSAPAEGVVVSADFEFDVPVRFDDDHMQLLAATRTHERWQGIQIVELRE